MKNSISYIVISLCLTLSHNVTANSSAPSLEKWQMKMIYHPTKPVLERESKGFVFIYDGFNENQVNQILDAKFDRIDHMMFTRVKLTDTSGKILLDPETGDELTADDGCD
jgi:hypothetical protein